LQALPLPRLDHRPAARLQDALRRITPNNARASSTLGVLGILWGLIATIVYWAMRIVP
jgi:hypothetical protein